MSNKYRCILGCPRKEDRTMHHFPRNPDRRAQWLQLIGIETNLRYIYLCGDHFSENQKFGKKVSMFAVPDRNLPPKWKYLENSNRPHYSENCSSNTKVQPQKSHISSDRVFPVHLSASQNPSTIEKFESNAIEDSTNIQQQEDREKISTGNEEIVDDEEPGIKSEDFEIRHRLSNKIILKGRYVQSEDNTIFSYTTPNDFSLEQQVDNLIITSKTQKEKLKILKSERLNLSKQLKKYKQTFLKITKELAKRKKLKIMNRKKKKPMVKFSNKR